MHCVLAKGSNNSGLSLLNFHEEQDLMSYSFQWLNWINMQARFHILNTI